MIIQEDVSLSLHTTFRIGGPARFFLSAATHQEVQETMQFAKTHKVPLRVFGGGSNLLVPDEGFPGAVLRCTDTTISFSEEGEEVVCTLGAGALWNEAVERAAAHGWWGIENLAGIPGTVGGAAVQNIGAYGAELSTVFVGADTVDLRTGESRTISAAEAQFGYRTSFFKTHPELCITSVRLRLSKRENPVLMYADLAKRKEEGVPLHTPKDIMEVVREIRSHKFPDLSREGTAGSFFKNPVLSVEAAHALTTRFPGLPAYPQQNGVKVSLAWILDHVLSLKGYTKGGARLFESQPLVIVAQFGTPLRDVESLAQEVATRVYEATNVTIEREVETFAHV